MKFGLRNITVNIKIKTKFLIFQLFRVADQYYYYTAKWQIMFHVSRKDARKQMLKFQVQLITDGTRTQIYAGLKSLSDNIYMKS